MYKIKIKKRQTMKHNGSMVIDANFEDVKNRTAFNHTLILPIDATETEIGTAIKIWLEEKEASDALPLSEMTLIDISAIDTGRIARKEYDKAKAELIELSELVALGAMDANDKKVNDKKTDVKSKYKDSYRKMEK